MHLPTRHSRALTIIAVLLALATESGSAAPGRSAESYDEDLCVTAQRILVNSPTMPVRVQRGQGDGFHTIQMSVDAATGELVVAASRGIVADGDAELFAYVACKMVDRDRASDQLGLTLEGPLRSCRDVNEHTFAVAWASLSDDERNRYAAEGRSLIFADDVRLPSGGEWLPADPRDYIGTMKAGTALTISAPSVQVPWDAASREFFQGTHHCKLITVEAMRRWMRLAAFTAGETLVPGAAAACTAPSATTARAGSCVFYFAPADAMFCTDYSGEGWTADDAAAACSKRHASREALAAADNRYTGVGGRYSPLGCAERSDVPPVAGTCVFHCGQADEVLWQIAGRPDPMMNRACDLYLEAR